MPVPPTIKANTTVFFPNPCNVPCRCTMSALVSGFALPVLVTAAALGLTLLKSAWQMCTDRKRKPAVKRQRGANSDFYDSMGVLLNWPGITSWFNWGLWRAGTDQTFSNAAAALCAAAHGCVDPNTETLIGASRRFHVQSLPLHLRVLQMSAVEAVISSQRLRGNFLGSSE